MNDTVSKNTTMSIVATALLGFSGILSETSMNVTFPTLQKVYHLPLSSLQWITTVYLLAVALSMTVSATLQQNVKEKTILNVSLILFTSGTILAFATSSFSIMIVGRAFQGLGTGIGMTLMFNLILERIPPQKIGNLYGDWRSDYEFSPCFRPHLWRFYDCKPSLAMDFHLILPVPLICFVLNHLYIENSQKGEKRPFDISSFILLALALITSLLAITSLEEGKIN